MLTEISKPRQIEGEAYRRWFSSEDMDLIVWQQSKQGQIIGFQLCYDKERHEKALTWKTASGFTHTCVDDGEDHKTKYKSTPILFNNTQPNIDLLLALFKQQSGQLDQHLLDLISDKICAYPAN